MSLPRHVPAVRGTRRRIQKQREELLERDYDDAAAGVEAAALREGFIVAWGDTIGFIMKPQGL